MVNHIAGLIQTMKPVRRSFDLPSPAKPSNHPRMSQLNELDLSHHELVATAVYGAQQWQRTRQAQVAEYRERERIPPDVRLNYYEPANSSLVLVASQVIGEDGVPDPERTGYGCGKTHIARAVLWSIRLIDEDGKPTAPTGIFYQANKLILELDATQQGQYIESMLRNRPMIVIDDVGGKGTEQVIPYVGEKLQPGERQARYYAVVNYCYNNGVGVVITSNSTLPELAEHIGGRAFSRLMEMAPKDQMVDLTGVPDYRKKLGGRA